ncbi:phage terminase large subunit [Arthrobacter sp. efr-133-TYG-118]|uniref:phage terminase large subunit n=1 Tax=Arthrobacter sp. efr-133-TYG-118 TaxID=3040279 RepID=UPI00254E923A|nr:phage terminase large subunit [Arthrobacter sp. efr-133-TYG-118]
MGIDWAELAARTFEAPPEPEPTVWETPGQLAVALNPAIKQTAALDLIDKELIRAFNTPDSRLIVSMPPQEGKSLRCGITFPLWVLTQDPSKRIAMTSFSDRLARRNSREVMNAIKSDGDLLGLAISKDVASQSEWQLAGDRGGIYAASVGGPLTGQKADLVIIDDPHKGAKEADSELQRDDVYDWWTSTVRTRLSPGAPVILILTRWHEDDLAGRFINAEDGHMWRVINIPAVADYDPDKGETDPLGRKPGEGLVSAQGHRDWAATKIAVGARTWNALYQGRPAPSEGGLFKRADWQRYNQPLWVEEAGIRRTTGSNDVIILSWDMTFKNTQNADYVVGQVWLHRGANVYLLDQVRKRMTFTETLAAFKAQVARWPQAAAKLVEDKANGTAVLDMLKKEIPGLIAITPHESKEARAAAVSPFVEAHNVYLPTAELAAWSEDLIDEAASFPNGAHDDQIDGLSQALQRLLVKSGQGSAFLAAMKKQAAALANQTNRIPPTGR